MPYILPEQREIINQEILALVDKAKTIPDFKANRGGILNYIITKIALEFLGEKSYKSLSLMRSAMEDASAEWYRKQLVPYEEMKIKINGDVE